MKMSQSWFWKVEKKNGNSLVRTLAKDQKEWDPDWHKAILLLMHLTKEILAWLMVWSIGYELVQIKLLSAEYVVVSIA